MIRQAIVRYLDARSSILEARAEKIRCAHKWKVVTAMQTWGTYDSNGEPIVRAELHVCETCGEHKKITFP